MASERTGGIAARAYRTLFDLGPIGDLSDGQLLERCATDRAEVAELAFAALVERHEALVWRACFGILRDRHRAEDAFQATFLVLSRRARSLWVRDSLGPWLHEVAARTARRHRAADRRRLDREARIAARIGHTAPTTTPPPLDDDLAAALHEELARLPTTLRAPLVLCDLEGATQAEAARGLGWPIGTLKSRQARGRRALRARLARRGFVSLGVGPLLDLGPLGAIPPRAARGLAMTFARRGFVSLGAPPAALRLARETLHAMLWIKLRPVAAALALGLASTGVGFVSSAQEPAPPPAVAALPLAGGPTASPSPPPAEPKPAVGAQSTAPRRGVLRIAQLRHAGVAEGSTWTAAYLNRVLGEKLRRKTSIVLGKLDPGDPDLIHYPLAFLPVEGSTPLGTRDLLSLRRRVEGGGTLFADAGLSEPANDATFRRLFDGLFDKGLEPIPPTDPLFSARFGFDLGQTVGNDERGRKVGPPELEGIRVGDCWGVIYSKYDIGKTFHLESLPPAVPGYDGESVARIVINVIGYATLPGDPVAEPPTPARPAGEAETPAVPAPPIAKDADARLKFRAQEIATHRARIAYDQARLKRELAELAVIEFEEVAYPRDLTMARNKMLTAEVELGIIQDRWRFLTEPRNKGVIPPDQILQGGYALKRAEFALDQDQTQLNALQKYTKDKQVKSLRSDVEKARTDELSREVNWKLEAAREAVLRPKVSLQFPTGTMEFDRLIGAFW